MEHDLAKAEGSKGPKMDWMYKPAALVDREEYLTGRSVDKSLKLLDEIEKGNNPTANEFNYLAEAEKDLTPMSIFASHGSGPIDIIKKIKDDPLYQIQKKEQESLKKLLQNPVKMKELNKLVEARSSGRSSSHKHKKKHKKHKKDDGSSSSSKRRRRSSSSSSDDRDRRKRKESREKVREHFSHSSSRSRRRKSSSSSDSDLGSDPEKKRKEIIEQFRRRALERKGGASKEEDRSRDRGRDRRPPPPAPARPASCVNSQRERVKLDEEELEKRRKEMMENAKWREQQRTKNVTKYREDEKKEEESLKNSRDTRDPDFIRKQLLEAASSGSVEQRVKSNSYNIQRSKSSMDQNFVKR